MWGCPTLAGTTPSDVVPPSARHDRALSAAGADVSCPATIASEMCDSSGVTTRPVSESRRYDFPPLWLVPIALIVGIELIVFVSTTLGVLGFIAGLAAIFWLQRRADAFVRARDSSEND